MFSQGLLKYFGNEFKEASSVHPYQFVEEGAEPNHLSFWLAGMSWHILWSKEIRDKVCRHLFHRLWDAYLWLLMFYFEFYLNKWSMLDGRNNSTPKIQQQQNWLRLAMAWLVSALTHPGFAPLLVIVLWPVTPAFLLARVRPEEKNQETGGQSFMTSRYFNRKWRIVKWRKTPNYTAYHAGLSSKNYIKGIR